ncbi:MAG: WD40 repeat domain-containing protein [Planctomycetota bacterium]
MATFPESADPKAAWVAAQWPHDRPLIACRFEPTGQFVFSGSEDNIIERFRVSDGQKVNLSGGHSTWVSALTFSNDGKILVSGGCDGKLSWWSALDESPTLLRSIVAHGTQWIRSIDTSPDGTRIVSGGNDRMVRLWNLSDGTAIREIAGHEKHVWSVAFHPNGQSIFSGDLGGVIRQWNTETGQEVQKFDAAALYSYNGGQQVDFGGVRTIAVSSDGKWLAAGGLHKASNPLGAVHEPLVLLFSLENPGAPKQQIAEGITQGVIWRLRWLSDGTLMGVSGGGSGGWLIFWKTDTDKDFHRFQLPGLARDMDLHPDGIQVATAHYDRHLRITKLSPKPAEAKI